MPGEDLIAKPGELPAFSLTILIPQEQIGTKIQSGPACSGLLHWPENQFLQMLFHPSVIGDIQYTKLSPEHLAKIGFLGLKPVSTS